MPIIIPGGAGSSTALIQDYSGLQLAAAAMVHRPGDTDITANMPLWIQLAENELFDRVIPRQSEVETTLTSTQGQNYIALPSGYLSPIELWFIYDATQNIRNLLTWAEPEDLPYWPNQTQPRYVAVDGENLRFDVNFDKAYSLPFRYVQTNALSASNLTNYLLTRRPDIYLFATLKQVALYTKDNDDLQKYTGLLEQAIKQFKASENRNRTIAPLRVDAALIGSGRERFNIYRGI
jgi:hypothetical protein